MRSESLILGRSSRNNTLILGMDHRYYTLLLSRSAEANISILPFWRELSSLLDEGLVFLNSTFKLLPFTGVSIMFLFCLINLQLSILFQCDLTFLRFSCRKVHFIDRRPAHLKTYRLLTLTFHVEYKISLPQLYNYRVCSFLYIVWFIFLLRIVG